MLITLPEPREPMTVEIKSLQVDSDAILETPDGSFLFTLGGCVLRPIIECPECKGTFPAQGKRKFCSRRCVNRTSQRRFVAKGRG